MGPLFVDLHARMHAAVVCEGVRKLEESREHAASTAQATGGPVAREGIAGLLAQALGPLAAALEAVGAQHGSGVHGVGRKPPAVPWLQLPLDLWAEGQAGGSSSSPAGEGGAGGERMPQAAAGAGRGSCGPGARVLVAAAERVVSAVVACLAACNAAAAWDEVWAGMGLLVERLAQLNWHCLRHPGALTDEAAMRRLEVRLRSGWPHHPGVDCSWLACMPRPHPSCARCGARWWGSVGEQ
jgi:hypothetical protein